MMNQKHNPMNTKESEQFVKNLEREGFDLWEFEYNQKGTELLLTCDPRKQ